MKYITNKAEISEHLELIDTLLDPLLDKSKEEYLVMQNIFNKKFKYLLFDEDTFFSDNKSENLNKYLKYHNERDFFLNGLQEDRHIVPYSYAKNNKIAYENFLPLSEGGEPHSFFTGLDNVCFEYLYYTKKAHWCGWFSVLWEIGIFAFETEDSVQKFMECFNETRFLTVREILDGLWKNAKPKYKEAFLKNYLELSYLDRT